MPTISPSPWQAWPSPRKNSAPGTATGKADDAAGTEAAIVHVAAVLGAGRGREWPGPGPARRRSSRSSARAAAPAPRAPGRLGEADRQRLAIDRPIDAPALGQVPHRRGVDDVGRQRRERPAGATGRRHAIDARPSRASPGSAPSMKKGPVIGIRPVGALNALPVEPRRIQGRSDDRVAVGEHGFGRADGVVIGSARRHAWPSRLSLIPDGSDRSSARAPASRPARCRGSRRPPRRPTAPSTHSNGSSRLALISWWGTYGGT